MIMMYNLTGLYPLISSNPWSLESAQACPGTDGRTFSVHGQTFGLQALERFNAIPQSSRFLIAQMTRVLQLRLGSSLTDVGQS